MEFLKKLRNAHKPIAMNGTQDQPVPHTEELTTGSSNMSGKPVNIDSTMHTETEDDDDDFITNEVKRRLKELRRNSFMVLIPEETCPCDEEEEEEEGETSSSDWRDVEAEGRQFWSGINAVYDIYCDRMLFFDRLSSHQLLELGSQALSTPSPRYGSKKLASPLRCLSLKKIESPEEESEQLQQPLSNPYRDLEAAYVAQTCLTWEALHCQYTELNKKISYQNQHPTSYNHSAQQFQQFQVLLQRFIENEPFELGSRPEIFARSRKSLPNLLQVPKIQAGDGTETRDDNTSDVVLAADFNKVVESSILCFRQFIKMDKKRSGGVRRLLGSQKQMGSTAVVQNIQASLDKKELKLKEVWKKTKNNKNKKSWPANTEDAEMLLGLIDLKIVSRVLRISEVSKDKLFWCEEKLKKLVFSDAKFQRDPSPFLFPC